MTGASGTWTLRALVILVVAAITASSWAAWDSRAADANPPRTLGPEERSADTTSEAPWVIGQESPPVGGPEQARATAALAEERLPLPKGGNFNGIRWEEAGGLFTEADVAFVTQYNAACQWYRALRDARETEVAKGIVQEVPNWSAIAGTEAAPPLAEAANEVRAGSFGPAARALLSQCQAAHAREVAWALQLGLPPST